ncbi:MAG: DUF2339 domain-containing protein [Planctomycetaceae bacterium]
MEECFGFIALIFLVLGISVIVYLSNVSATSKSNQQELSKLKQRLRDVELQLRKLRANFADLEMGKPVDRPETSTAAETTEELTSPETLRREKSRQTLERWLETEKEEAEELELEIVPEEQFSNSSHKTLHEEVRSTPSDRNDEPGKEIKEYTFSSDESNTWEQLLAGQWLSWLGAITVIIGAGFFFKYTIDMGWVGPRERVILGLITGVLTFAGGVWAHRRDYSYLSQGLIGTAMGILYFCIFAAVQWYQLVPETVGFTGLIIVTTLTLGFAAWSNTQVTAILGMFGGYLTPLMLWPGEHSLTPLFSYLFVLNMGVLFVSTLRNWPILQLLALGASAVSWSTWLGNHFHETDIKLTFIWMTAFFGQFIILSVWNHLVQKRKLEPVDLILMLATPFLYLGGYLWITQNIWHDSQGLLAICLTIVYALLAAVCWFRHPDNKLLMQMQVGIALCFFVLAVPLQLDGHWIPLAWSAQSLLISIAGFRLNNGLVRMAGLILLGFVQFFLMSYTVETVQAPYRSYWQFVLQEEGTRSIIPQNSFGYQFEISHLFNERSFCFLAAMAVTMILAWEFRRWASKTEVADNPTISPSWGLLSPASSTEFMTLSGVLTIEWMITLLVMLLNETLMFGHLLGWIKHAYAPVYTLMLSVTALIAWGYFTRRKPHWGLNFIYFLMFATGLLLVVNSFHHLDSWRNTSQQIGSAGWSSLLWSWPVLNVRFLGHFSAILAALWFTVSAKRLHRFNSDSTNDSTTDLSTALEPELWRMTFGLFTLAATFVLITLEAYAYGTQQHWGTTTSLSVTGVWICYGLFLMILGIGRKSADLRTASLVVFLVTTLKVYLYDLWYLDKTIRMVAFIGLGVALLSIPWLYKRYGHLLKSNSEEKRKIADPEE